MCKQYQFDLSVEMELSEQDVWRFTTTASGELYVMTISTTMMLKLPATCLDSGMLLLYCNTISLFHKMYNPDTLRGFDSGLAVSHT